VVHISELKTIKNPPISAVFIMVRSFTADKYILKKKNDRTKARSFILKYLKIWLLLAHLVELTKLLS
jgi:hypothetical protein